jgi:hypothetical protein
MENSLIKSPMQYLEQATGTLRDLGITPVRPDFAPINALLEKISDLDHDRITVISRTLGQTEVFNEVVRDQTQAMDIGRRYEDIAKAFNSIREKNDGRSTRTRQNRFYRAGDKYLDEIDTRRYRRPVRQNPRDLSRRLS